jgi:hypothetical protein
MSDPPDPRENLTAALVRDYDDEQLVLWIHALQDREEELEAKVKELERRIPDPDDLTRVVTLAMQAVGATENLYDFGCVARVVKTLPARATLEVKDE